MVFWWVSSNSWATVASASMVIGSLTTPDSNFLTLRTSLACCSMVMFLWMMPMPPSWAMAMARRASVTVSMAADTSGMLSSIPRVRCVLRHTSLGNTSEYPGTRRMSSKVRASWRIRSIAGAPEREKWKRAIIPIQRAVLNWNHVANRIIPPCYHAPMNNDDAIFQRLGAEREVLTVSQLNARARNLLEEV